MIVRLQAVNDNIIRVTSTAEDKLRDRKSLVTLNSKTTLNSKLSTLNFLDIGTGSGVIALMLAQRFSNAHIVGIDIDEAAAQQAQANFAASPWSNRLVAECVSLQDYTLNSTPRFLDFSTLRFFDSSTPQLPYSSTPLPLYSLITSNPPYFRSSLKCPDEGRKQARHTDTLSYDELVRCSAELLAQDGVLALILPQEAQEDLLTIAAANGLHLWRLTHVRTSPNKPAKRVLIALTKEVRDLEEDELLLSHDHPLFKDFYL